MTVKELIEKLKTLDQDKIIVYPEEDGLFSPLEIQTKSVHKLWTNCYVQNWPNKENDTEVYILR